MRNQSTNDSRLELIWTPVTLPDGRTRMEARWILVPQSQAPASAAPHAA
jgi:hypothetical protein